VNLFQQQKNKRFSYIPRHLKESKTNSDENIKSEWNSIRNKGKYKGKPLNKLIMLLIVLGMIIALWYVLMHYETT